MALMHSPVDPTWQVSVKMRRALTDAVRRENMGPLCLVCSSGKYLSARLLMREGNRAGPREMVNTIYSILREAPRLSYC